MEKDIKDKNEKYKRDIDKALFKVWKNDRCSAFDISLYLKELLDDNNLYQMILGRYDKTELLDDNNLYQMILDRYDKTLTVRLFVWIAKRLGGFK